jgi:hypothetical protein
LTQDAQRDTVIKRGMKSMDETIYQNRWKVYLTVQCTFYPDGRPPVPSVIWWEDGRKFEIDKVIDTRRAASTKAGGIGVRYACRIGEHETYIWFEDGTGRWFAERKGAPEPQSSPGVTYSF